MLPPLLPPFVAAGLLVACRCYRASPLPLLLQSFPSREGEEMVIVALVRCQHYAKEAPMHRSTARGGVTPKLPDLVNPGIFSMNQLHRSDREEETKKIVEVGGPTDAARAPTCRPRAWGSNFLGIFLFF